MKKLTTEQLEQAAATVKEALEQSMYRNKHYFYVCIDENGDSQLIETEKQTDGFNGTMIFCAEANNFDPVWDSDFDTINELLDRTPEYLHDIVYDLADKDAPREDFENTFPDVYVEMFSDAVLSIMCDITVRVYQDETDLNDFLVDVDY
ncbi:MAG: hypothetical protein MJY78_11260 [Fibrobacter sp.]|nr:hypothetical protein [Fibrobacter sp.]